MAFVIPSRAKIIPIGLTTMIPIFSRPQAIIITIPTILDNPKIAPINVSEHLLKWNTDGWKEIAKVVQWNDI